MIWRVTVVHPGDERPQRLYRLVTLCRDLRDMIDGRLPQTEGATAARHQLRNQFVAHVRSLLACERPKHDPDQVERCPVMHRVLIVRVRLRQRRLER